MYFFLTPGNYELSSLSSTKPPLQDCLQNYSESQKLNPELYQIPLNGGGATGISSWGNLVLLWVLSFVRSMALNTPEPIHLRALGILALLKHMFLAAQIPFFVVPDTV